MFGPVQGFTLLSTINASNERIKDWISGKQREQLAPPGTFLWFDVREMALAHNRALEVPEAGGNRFFLVAGHFSNAMVVNAIKQRFSGLVQNLPQVVMSDLPEDING